MKEKVYQPHESSLGIQANLAVMALYLIMAVLSWVKYISWASWAAPLVFFLMEKKSAFVKYQSAQALAIGLIRAAIAAVLQIVVWILTPRDLYSALEFLAGRSWGAWSLVMAVSTIISVIALIIEAYIVSKAFRYIQAELPVISPLALKASEILEKANIKAGFGDGQNNANNNNEENEDGIIQ